MRDLLFDILKTSVKLVLGRGVRYSYSQFGEDAVVQAMLKFKKNGFYIDIGAYHPVLYSNTYGLYQRGWNGIAIDPNGDLKKVFNVFRPRDTFIVSAIANDESTLTYHTFTDASYNTFQADEAATLTQQRKLIATGTRAIKAQRLGTVLQKEGVTAVDFMNIDVEGMDVEILRGYDWKIRPRVIAVEDDTFDATQVTKSEVFVFLTEKGYRFAGLGGQTLIFRDVA